MRTFILLFFLLINTTKLYSQRDSTSIWYHTIKFAPTFTNTYLNKPLPTSFSGTIQRKHGNFNGLLGLSSMRGIKDNLYFETGFFVGRKSFSRFEEDLDQFYDKYSGLISSDTTREWLRNYEHFIRIPIGINYDFQTKNGTFFIGASIVLDLTILSDKNILESNNPQRKYFDFNTGSGARNVDLMYSRGVLLKFGYTYNIKDNYSLTFSTFYSNTLREFDKLDYALGLTLGIRKKFNVEKIFIGPKKSKKNIEARNNIYIEGLGTGILASLNYERRLIAGKYIDLDARVGFNHAPRILNYNWCFPVSLSLCYGKSINKFEILGGYTTGIINGIITTATINSHIGYRLDSNNMLFFRAAIGALYLFQGSDILPDFAFAIGRRF